MEQLTLWSEEPHAKASASQEKEKDLMELLDSSWSISDFFVKCVRAGLSGKMSPEVCHLGTPRAAILNSFSANGLTSGIMCHGEFLTLNTSEWPSDAAVCSLSDTLDTGSIPQKYFLSPIACAGILRRAEKRGKRIPEPLKEALEKQAAN